MTSRRMDVGSFAPALSRAWLITHLSGSWLPESEKQFGNAGHLTIVASGRPAIFNQIVNVKTRVW